MNMKKISVILAILLVIVALVGCGASDNAADGASIYGSTADGAAADGGNEQNVTQPASGAPQAPAQGGGNPVTVMMADGSKKTAAYTNGFYQFETNSPVKVMELAYLHNTPAAEMATLKLVLEGDAPNAIAFLTPSNIVHDDYQAALENAASVLNIEDFDSDGLYGTDGSWQMPYDYWNYEVRVFDDRQAEAKTELAFVPVAAQGDIKIGELVQLETSSALKVNALTLEKTEYNAGDNEQIVCKLDAEGYGDEAWIGTVPSGVPHGDDDRNDTYDCDFEYLSALENGTVTLGIPESAGNYDLRINDGAVEIAYVSIVVK